MVLRKKNVTDMISILISLEPSRLPRFGIDLSRFQPLDINSIDVSPISKGLQRINTDISNTSMLTNMLSMMADMKDQIDAMGKQVAEVTKVIAAQKNQQTYASIISQTKEIEPQSAKSSKQGKPDTFSATPNVKSARRKLPNLEDVMTPTDTMEDLSVSAKAGNSIQIPHDIAGMPSKSNSADVSQNKLTSNRENEEFKVVTRKKRQKFVVGSGTRNGLISNGHNVSLFVSRLKPETEPAAIEDYIVDVFNVSMTCEKLKTKFNFYSSFKIEGYCKNIEEFYNPDKWPDSVLVRRYWPPKKQ